MAIECLNLVINLDTYYACAWANEWIILHKLDSYKEAIKCFDKALDLIKEDSAV